MDKQKKLLADAGRVLAHEGGASRDRSERDGGRLILESKHFAAFVDFAPRYPYQFSIYPKGHESSFQDCPSEEIADLAQIFSTSLHRLQHLAGDRHTRIAQTARPAAAQYSLYFLAEPRTLSAG